MQRPARLESMGGKFSYRYSITMVALATYFVSQHFCCMAWVYVDCIDNLKFIANYT